MQRDSKEKHMLKTTCFNCSQTWYLYSEHNNYQDSIFLIIICTHTLNLDTIIQQELNQQLTRQQVSSALFILKLRFFYVLVLRNFISRHKRGPCSIHLQLHHLHFVAMILIRLILVHMIWSSNINVSSHHCILSMSFNFLVPDIWITLVMKFLKLQLHRLQDLDKRYVVSAQENGIRDMRR